MISYSLIYSDIKFMHKLIGAARIELAISCTQNMHDTTTPYSEHHMGIEPI